MNTSPLAWRQSLVFCLTTPLIALASLAHSEERSEKLSIERYSIIWKRPILVSKQKADPLQEQSLTWTLKSILRTGERYTAVISNPAANKEEEIKSDGTSPRGLTLVDVETDSLGQVLRVKVANASRAFWVARPTQPVRHMPTEIATADL